jgi:hypothetical protein
MAAENPPCLANAGHPRHAPMTRSLPDRSTPTPTPTPIATLMGTPTPMQAPTATAMLAATPMATVPLVQPSVCALW